MFIVLLPSKQFLHVHCYTSLVYALLLCNPNLLYALSIQIYALATISTNNLLQPHSYTRIIAIFHISRLMPTHRNVQWEPVVLPQGLEDEQEVFLMRTSGEIFLSYEEYISRLEWYLDKNWICDRTARSGLNFEQALESERTADKIVSYFPPHLYEIVLKVIQGNKLNLDQLIQHIYTFLQSKSNAKRFISSYKVTFCKDVIRQFVRDNTYKKISIPGSSYVVKKEIAERFNLKLIARYVPKRIRIKARSNDTPEQLAQKRENERVNKATFNFDINNLYPILSKFHNCIRKKKTNLKIVDEFQTDPDFPNLIIKCCNCEFSHTLTGVKRIESHEYPKPDEDLTPWERATKLSKPSVTVDPVFSECKGDLLFAWHFLHTAHEFIELSAFPFRELEDALIWERDHKDDSPVSLLSETLTAIVRCLIRFVTGRLCRIVRHTVGGYKAVNRGNWEQKVRGYVKSCIQFLREVKAQDEDEMLPFEVPQALRLFVSSTATLMEATYKRFCIPTKAKLLMFLCEHVGMLGKFKEFVDQFTGQLHDARSKLWEERSRMFQDNRTGEEILNGNGDETNIVRNQSLILNGKPEEIDRNIKRLMTQVKIHQQKVRSFCVEPLGQDRDFHIYWYLPTIGYRVHVEAKGEWSYLDSKDGIERLIGYLNEKGERESVLKERLIKVKEDIFSSIDSYLASFLIRNEIRRSARSILKHKQSYVNSYL